MTRSMIDKGIVAAFDRLGNTAYTDPKGNAATATAITTAYQSGQFLGYIGKGTRAVLMVRAAFGGGGATTYTIYCRVKRLETDLPTILWKPAELMLDRLDGGAATAIEQPIVAADVLGADAGVCCVALGTTSAVLSGQIEVLVKSDIAPAAGDYCFIALSAG